jgi:hypothetical protein
MTILTLPLCLALHVKLQRLILSLYRSILVAVLFSLAHSGLSIVYVGGVMRR